MFSRRTVLAGLSAAIPLGLSARSYLASYEVGVYSKNHDAKLIETNLAKAPPGVIVEFIASDDGGLVRLATWKPDPVADRAHTVLLALGYGDFIEKHYTTIAALVVRGFTVAVFDWRGQGHSSRYIKSPDIGYVPCFENHLLDLENAFNAAKQSSPSGTISVIAISMGGLVTLRSLQQKRILPESSILLAPLLEFAYGNFLTSVLANTAYIGGFSKEAVPGWQPLDLQRADGHFGISESEHSAWASILKSAPTLGLSAPSFKWVQEMASAAISAERLYSDPLVCPTLVISAGSDTIVRNSAHERLTSSNSNAHGLLIDGAPHELLLAPTHLSSQAVNFSIDWITR